MGLKKIAEMRKELWAKAEALEKFEALAKEFNDTYAKIQKSYEALDKLREDQRKKIVNVQTHGVKEFEDYKRSLYAIYQNYGNRPLPTDPLRAVVAAQKKKVDEAIAERVAKLAASFPSEVKKGMVFKMDASGKLLEITSDAKESTNANLKGDAKTYYEVSYESGEKGLVKLSDLKSLYKFIRA